MKADGVKAARDNDIVLNPIEGVRYTVPGTINVANMDEQITVRFRVGGVYKNCYVSAYLMMRESFTENVRSWHREKWKRLN